MQQRIINRVEGDDHYRRVLDQNSPEPDLTAADAIIVSARQITKTVDAKAIACFSLRGSTVLRASKNRPTVPILALCPFKETARQLALSWGVYPGKYILFQPFCFYPSCSLVSRNPPDLPKAGSYGYTVAEEDMFDDGRKYKCSNSDSSHRSECSNGCFLLQQ